MLRSWMSGLLRCGHCDHAVKVDYTYNKNSGNSWRYFTCSGYNSVRGCQSSGIKLNVDEVEAIVYNDMKEHIEEFEIARKIEKKPSTEADKIRSEILKIEAETAKLMEKLADADEVLFGYIQNRIGTLHSTKNELEKKLMLVDRRVKKIDTTPLLGPLNKWETLTVEEKNNLARMMIEKIYISVEKGVIIHYYF